MNKLRRKLSLKILSMVIISFFCSISALAGGFQLFEENVTNMGNSYAGMSAQADDATTEFYNPAGMTRLNNGQAVGSTTWIDLNIDANEKTASNTLTLFTPVILFPISTTTVPVTGPTSFNPGRIDPVPAFHFVYPFENKFAIGFGITSPFGLDTIYPSNALSRYLATTSSVQTVNLGFEIAYQFNQHFSLGVGPDSQYLSATLDQAVPGFTPGAPDGSLNNKGDSWGWGMHAGALYQFTPNTRVGLAYHSQVHQEIKGTATSNLFQPGTGMVEIAGNFNARVTMPDYADLSLYHDFNPQWAILYDVEFTDWSAIQDITAIYQSSIAAIVPSATIPLKFRNTFRFALGFNYRPLRSLTLRTGAAYDETPVPNDMARTFRLPDANRYWLSAGAQYILNKYFTIDGGYAHLFTPGVSNNNTIVTNGIFPGLNLPFTLSSNASSNFSSNVNEVGVQLTWNIV